MKTNLLSIVFLLLTAVAGHAKEKAHPQLTTEQKVTDFDSLYTQLKGAYPYFEVNKRQNNIDWVSNYDSYKMRIVNSENDAEYLAQLDTIMKDLNCGHADLLPTKYYHYMHSRYKMASLILWSYRRYVKELNKNGAKKKNKYWTEIAKQLYPSSGIGSNLAELDEEENISFETYEESSTAVIHIKSFLYEHIKADKQALLTFYQTLNNYNNLVIDVQGNTGGDTRYWQNNIVPFLIDSTINYSLYMAFKNSPAFYRFAGNMSGFPADSIKLMNMPEELQSGQYLIKQSTNSIEPDKKSIHYKGNIYVLADHNVYSSSEAFVNFCQSSGFAKVTGETTGGDGVGSDPFIYTLPISGIAVRYPGLMGLNGDGSSNEEKGTTPEIKLIGQSESERFEALKNYILKNNDRNLAED